MSLLPSEWQPHTLTPAAMKRDFPLLDPHRTLRAFIAFKQSKNARSNAWDAEFYAFCDYRQRQAEDQRRTARDTDSLGLPLDAKKRATMQSTVEGDYGIRFLDRLEHHKANGLTVEEAHAAAVADLEGESR